MTKQYQFLAKKSQFCLKEYPTFASAIFRGKIKFLVFKGLEGCQITFHKTYKISFEANFCDIQTKKTLQKKLHKFSENL